MRIGMFLLAALVAGIVHAAPANEQGADGPAGNYTGQYLTGQFGVGVFIEHVDAKAFLTYATYDADGAPIWYVMPDGRWQANAAQGRSEFVGLVYRTRRGQESPPSITVTPVGNATWFPTGPDTARLFITVGDFFQSANLTRFRL